MIIFLDSFSPLESVTLFISIWLRSPLVNWKTFPLETSTVAAPGMDLHGFTREEHVNMDFGYPHFTTAPYVKWAKWEHIAEFSLTLSNTYELLRPTTNHELPKTWLQIHPSKHLRWEMPCMPYQIEKSAGVSLTCFLFFFSFVIWDFHLGLSEAPRSDSSRSFYSWNSMAINWATKK